MKTMSSTKLGAILVALFLLALAFPLSIAPVSASGGSVTKPAILWLTTNVSYSYVVAQGYPGRGSGSTSCGGQTYSSSSSVSGSTLSVSWSGPTVSLCDLGDIGMVTLYIHDSAGTVVYNGQEFGASGHANFQFLDYQVIVYVSVTWYYIVIIGSPKS